MRKEHWVAILAALVLASPLARAAQPAAPPRPAHWSDRLKNIPLGPFHLDVGGSVRFRYEHQNDFNQQRYADDRRPGLRSDGFLLSWRNAKKPVFRRRSRIGSAENGRLGPTKNYWAARLPALCFSRRR